MNAQGIARVDNIGGRPNLGSRFQPIAIAAEH
jgi:hypothetical protein